MNARLKRGANQRFSLVDGNGTIVRQESYVGCFHHVFISCALNRWGTERMGKLDEGRSKQPLHRLELPAQSVKIKRKLTRRPVFSVFDFLIGFAARQACRREIGLFLKIINFDFFKILH